MEKQRIPLAYLAVGFTLIAIVVYYLFLPSNFEVVGYHKKQMTNGSNFRVYSVAVKSFQDSQSFWDKMKSFGDEQIFTNGGQTIVYFFNGKNNTPNVSTTGISFDKKYEPYCLAVYRKTTGKPVAFNKHPFEN